LLRFASGSGCFRRSGWAEQKAAGFLARPQILSHFRVHPIGDKLYVHSVNEIFQITITGMHDVERKKIHRAAA
jgi:hypothetical protein